MIKVVTTNGERVNEFGGYGKFFMWMINSNYNVVDFGKNIDELKRDGGVVTVEPITKDYLERLHIKED